MRIVPFVLIAVGVVGVLKHYGLIDPAFLHMLWPLLLIAIGVAMLVRGPRWRAELRERRDDRWERRLHRRYGPGWASLSEAERERFRAGMRQWRGPADDDDRASPGASVSDDARTSPPSNAPSPAERR